MRSIETVPELIVVATGVVLSVKEPKVPMPATAAAAPMMPSEPTTLRVVVERLPLALMFVLPVSVSPALPATRRTLEALPQATRPESARNPQGCDE